MSYVDATPSNVTKADRLEQAGVPVVWDSGAFSVFTGTATIDVDTHAHWVTKRQAAGSTARYIGLDVIGDGTASLHNYRRQLEAGADVEPTVHYGDPVELVHDYLDLGASWVNVGGIAPMGNGKKARLATAFAAAIRLATRGRASTHGLGATPPAIAGAVPFDAIDSTYWLGPARFGTQSLFDPDRGDWRRYTLVSSRTPTDDRAWRRIWKDGRWLRDTYGIAPAAMHRDNQDEMLDAAAESHRRFGQWLAERHGIDVTVYLAGGRALTLDPEMFT